MGGVVSVADFSDTISFVSAAAVLVTAVQSARSAVSAVGNTITELDSAFKDGLRDAQDFGTKQGLAWSNYATQGFDDFKFAVKASSDFASGSYNSTADFMSKHGSNIGLTAASIGMMVLTNSGPQGASLAGAISAIASGENPLDAIMEASIAMYKTTSIGGTIFAVSDGIRNGENPFDVSLKILAAQGEGEALAAGTIGSAKEGKPMSEIAEDLAIYGGDQAGPGGGALVAGTIASAGGGSFEDAAIEQYLNSEGGGSFKQQVAHACILAAVDAWQKYDADDTKTDEEKTTLFYDWLIDVTRTIAFPLSDEQRANIQKGSSTATHEQTAGGAGGGGASGECSAYLGIEATQVELIDVVPGEIFKIEVGAGGKGGRGGTRYRIHLQNRSQFHETGVENGGRGCPGEITRITRLSNDQVVLTRPGGNGGLGGFAGNTGDHTDNGLYPGDGGDGAPGGLYGRPGNGGNGGKHTFEGKNIYGTGGSGGVANASTYEWPSYENSAFYPAPDNTNGTDGKTGNTSLEIRVGQGGSPLEGYGLSQAGQGGAGGWGGNSGTSGQKGGDGKPGLVRIFFFQT